MGFAEAFGYVVNIIFVILIAVLSFSIIIRSVKNRFSAEKCVSATVINKEAYTKQTMSHQGPRTTRKYTITFLAGTERMYFDVSEFSYSDYEINQTGTLKYKGSRIIDFS